MESSEMSIPAAVYSVMMYGFGAIPIMMRMGRRLVPVSPYPASLRLVDVLCFYY